MIVQYKLIVLIMLVVMNVHVKKDIWVMGNFVLMKRDPTSTWSGIFVPLKFFPAGDRRTDSSVRPIVGPLDLC